MIDLSNTMKDIQCKIISISINLYEYLKKGYTHNVYNVAFDFLLERYIYETENKKKGIIMLEARGKDEDKDYSGIIEITFDLNNYLEKQKN